MSVLFAIALLVLGGVFVTGLLGIAAASADVARAVGPVYGRSFEVTVISGRVFRDSQRGGSLDRLRGRTVLTNGATIDLRHGLVRITSRLPGTRGTTSATATGAQVTITQTRGSGAVTTVRLADENFTSCGLAEISRRKPKHRYHVDVSGTSEFQVDGASGNTQPVSHNGAWETTDTCGATSVSDRRGQLHTRFGDAPPAQDLLPGERRSGFCDRSPRAAREHHFCATASSYVSPADLSFSIALPTSASQYRLCIAPPGTAAVCHRYPLAKENRVKAGVIFCSAGPAGAYVADWRVGSTDLVPSVTIQSDQTGNGLSCQFIPIGAVFGRSFGVQPISGTTTVQSPGAAPKSLTVPEVVPFGTIVDTTTGIAAVIAKTPSGDENSAVVEGGAVDVTQDVEDGGITNLESQPASYAACSPMTPHAEVRATEISADSAFRLQSRFATETPTGDGEAGWIAIDRCGQTDLQVNDGGLEVQGPYQSFSATAPTSAQTECDSAVSPRMCTSVSVNTETQIASFYVSEITDESDYLLCDQQAALTCGTFLLSGSGSLRQGEVVCTGATDDGNPHGVAWSDDAGDVIGSLASPVNPLFTSTACTDEVGSLGASPAMAGWRNHERNHSPS